MKLRAINYGIGAIIGFEIARRLCGTEAAMEVLVIQSTAIILWYMEKKGN